MVAIEKTYIEVDGFGFACCITTNSYAKHFNHAQMLFGVAKRDFPELTPNRVEVVTLGGSRNKGMMAVTFQVKVRPSGDDWVLVKRLEPIC